jgi:hypothetical protein
MNTLRELRTEMLILIEEYPNHKMEMEDLYLRAMMRIMSGKDEANECTIVLSTMLELVNK